MSDFSEHDLVFRIHAPPTRISQVWDSHSPWILAISWITRPSDVRTNINVRRSLVTFFPSTVPMRISRYIPQGLAIKTMRSEVLFTCSHVSVYTYIASVCPSINTQAVSRRSMCSTFCTCKIRCPVFAIERCHCCASASSSSMRFTSYSARLWVGDSFCERAFGPAVVGPDRSKKHAVLMAAVCVSRRGEICFLMGEGRNLGIRCDQNIVRVMC